MSQDSDTPSSKAAGHTTGARSGVEPQHAPPLEALSDAEARHAPVSGTCSQCGCALGYAASQQGGAWFCCGGCAGSGRCTCGCDPELLRSLGSDRFVPTRRMFASRRPDELAGGGELRNRQRAFPFADRRRGR